MAQQIKPENFGRSAPPEEARALIKTKNGAQQTPSAASLTAGMVQRGRDPWRGGDKPRVQVAPAPAKAPATAKTPAKAPAKAKASVPAKAPVIAKAPASAKAPETAKASDKPAFRPIDKSTDKSKAVNTDGGDWDTDAAIPDPAADTEPVAEKPTPVAKKATPVAVKGAVDDNPPAPTPIAIAADEPSIGDVRAARRADGGGEERSRGWQDFGLFLMVFTVASALMLLFTLQTM